MLAFLNRFKMSLMFYINSTHYKPYVEQPIRQRPFRDLP